jgi:hypothetical protein
MRTLRVLLESNIHQRSEEERRLTNALHWTPALLRFGISSKGRVLAGASDRGALGMGAR